MSTLGVLAHTKSKTSLGWVFLISGKSLAGQTYTLANNNVSLHIMGPYKHSLITEKEGGRGVFIFVFSVKAL